MDIWVLIIVSTYHETLSELHRYYLTDHLNRSNETDRERNLCVESFTTEQKC